MRTLLIFALVLMGITAVGAIFDVQTCEPGPLGECGNNLVYSALLFLLGFCGLVLALIALIWGIVRAINARQWGWILLLCVGILVPLPLGLVLSDGLEPAYGPNAVQSVLPAAAGTLLASVAVFVFSFVFSSARQSFNTANRAGGKPPEPRAGEASGSSAAEARDGNPLTTRPEGVS